MKTYFYSSSIAYVLAVLLGIISGMSDMSILQNLGVLISETFIRIFKCISLPIISLSIIVTLATYSSTSSTKKIWQRTLLYTISTTVMAACVSCILYLIINPGNTHISIDNYGIEPKNKQVNYFQYIINLVPSNIFSPFLEHQVMGVLLLGMVVGISIHYIHENESKIIITNFFRGVHGIFLVVTRWLIMILPLGLYGFISTTIMQLREGIDIKSIGEYLSVIVLANLLQGFLILPLWLRFNNIRPFKTMKGVLPALSIAFVSKSSTSTLPITIEVSEKNLKINPKISRFVLPLCTSINMNGCSAFIFTTVIYLLQNHGVEISSWTMVVWIVIATISAIGNAGVPMGCFFLSASLLSSMNVPITMLGIILPFYGIIDMIETSLNVWSDVCVAKVVNERESLSQEKIYNNKNNNILKNN